MVIVPYNTIAEEILMTKPFQASLGISTGLLYLSLYLIRLDIMIRTCPQLTWHPTADFSLKPNIDWK